MHKRRSSSLSRKELLTLTRTSTAAVRTVVTLENEKNETYSKSTANKIKQLLESENFEECSNYLKRLNETTFEKLIRDISLIRDTSLIKDTSMIRDTSLIRDTSSMRDNSLIDILNQVPKSLKILAIIYTRTAVADHRHGLLTNLDQQGFMNKIISWLIKNSDSQNKNELKIFESNRTNLNKILKIIAINNPGLKSKLIKVRESLERSISALAYYENFNSNSKCDCSDGLLGIKDSSGTGYFQDDDNFQNNYKKSLLLVIHQPNCFKTSLEKRCRRAISSLTNSINELQILKIEKVPYKNSNSNEINSKNYLRYCPNGFETSMKLLNNGVSNNGFKKKRLLKDLSSSETDNTNNNQSQLNSGSDSKEMQSKSNLNSSIDSLNSKLKKEEDKFDEKLENKSSEEISERCKSSLETVWTRLGHNINILKSINESALYLGEAVGQLRYCIEIDREIISNVTELSEKLELPISDSQISVIPLLKSMSYGYSKIISMVKDDYAKFGNIFQSSNFNLNNSVFFQSRPSHLATSLNCQVSPLIQNDKHDSSDRRLESQIIDPLTKKENNDSRIKHRKLTFFNLKPPKFFNITHRTFKIATNTQKNKLQLDSSKSLDRITDSISNEIVTKENINEVYSKDLEIDHLSNNNNNNKNNNNNNKNNNTMNDNNISNEKNSDIEINSNYCPNCRLTENSNIYMKKNNLSNKSGERIDEFNEEIQISKLKEKIEKQEEEITNCKASLSTLREREQVLVDRLSKQAQMQIERSSTHFENLGMGSERPSQLISRYGSLYSEHRLETMDSLDHLSDMLDLDELKVKLLMSVVILAFRSATKSLSEIQKNIGCQLTSSLNKSSERLTSESSLDTVNEPPKANFEQASLKKEKLIASDCSRLTEAMKRDIKDTVPYLLRKYSKLKDLSSMVQEVYENVITTLHDCNGLKQCKRMKSYIAAVVRLCWLLSIQNPPYFPEFKSEEFDPEKHERFFDSNSDSQTITAYVWPGLVEGENGPCVYKSVVIT